MKWIKVNLAICSNDCHLIVVSLISTQLAIACSKLTIETLEQDVKLFKINFQKL